MMRTNSTLERYRSLHLELVIAGSVILAVAILLPLATRPTHSPDVVAFDVDLKEVSEGFHAPVLAGADAGNSSSKVNGSVADLIIN